MRADSGSIAPLVAGYLALCLLAILGSAAIGVAMIASNRVQAVADSALLYAHDRSVVRGIPSQGALQNQVQRFLELAPSARRIGITSFQAEVSGAISELELCARVNNPLSLGSISLCKVARAESFILR